MGKIVITQEENQVLLEVHVTSDGELIRAIMSLMTTALNMMEEPETEDSVLAVYEGICGIHLEEIELGNIRKMQITEEELMEKKKNIYQFKK